MQLKKGEPLKSDSNIPKNFVIVCFNKTPFKNYENAFYFILKALFALKIFQFSSLYFDHVEETA